MDNWQRTCATRDSGRTIKGTILYLIIISAFAIAYCLCGMFSKAVIEANLPAGLKDVYTKGANPLSDIFLLLQYPSHAPVIFFAIAAIALLAAAMSTANTFLIVSSHSFVSDLLLAVRKKTSIHDVSLDDSKLFIGLAQAIVVGMGAFVIGTWLILVLSGILRDPLSFFFIAYSLQFSLLAPLLFARRKLEYRPAAKAIYISILVGIITSIIAGSTFWSMLQPEVQRLIGLNPDDRLLWFLPGEWMALTPVVTLLFGLIPLIPSVFGVWRCKVLPAE